MEKTIMILLVDNRDQIAPKVQEVLTEFAGVIRCRLGVHDGPYDCQADSSQTPPSRDAGLIILQLCCSDCASPLEDALHRLGSVQVKTVTMGLD